jgi:hypothetical protein
MDNKKEKDLATTMKQLLFITLLLAGMACTQKPKQPDMIFKGDFNLSQGMEGDRTGVREDSRRRPSSYDPFYP